MIKKHKGLTLIELLAIISIIAILFVLLIPQISNAIKKSKETGVITDFRSYETAARTYFMETGASSKSIDGLNNFLDPNLKLKKTIEEDVFRSKKTNPYNSTYNLMVLSDTIINIITQDIDSKETFELLITYEDGEIKTRTYGLSNDIGETNRFVKDDIEYIEHFGNELTAFNYLGTDKKLVIPNEIEGKPVKFLSRAGRSWVTGFGRIGFTEVTLSDNIIFIGQQALSGNSFTQLKLPNELLALAPGSIGTSSLKEVVFNNKLEYVGLAAFSGHRVTHLNIPSSVKFIDYSGFYSSNANSSLFSYSFNNPNAILGTNAFSPLAIKK